MMSSKDLIEPIHPGEILREDFIEGFGITQNKLAVAMGVSPRRQRDRARASVASLRTRPVRLARYSGCR